MSEMTPADHAAAITKHGKCPANDRCTPPIPESSDCAGCLTTEEHLAALVAQAETARERAHHAERERDAALVMLNQHKLRETHRAELVAEAAVEGFAIIETMADGTVFTGQESREALAHALGLISGTALSRRERVAALAGGDSR